MPVTWAARRASSLLTVEEGRRRLDFHLQWTVKDSIDSNSFLFPATGLFSIGLALALAGYREESISAFRKAGELAEASPKHQRDTGTPFFNINQKTMHYLLFACNWLLELDRGAANLSRALFHLEEAERRAGAEGLELGDDGYEEMALLHVLHGNGQAALDALSKIDNGSVDGAIVSPTRMNTLTLAAHHMLNPVAEHDCDSERRLLEGVAGVLREEFRKPSPDSLLVLVWLDLPNVLFKRQGDPWAMLAQVNEMVDG